MIGVDWGTSSLRAWRMDPRTGAPLDARSVPGGGILSVPEGGFPDALRAAIGDWLAEGESEVLMCGMVGSRQGWVEVPYLPLPAGAAEIAAALTEVEGFDPAVRVSVVPGLTARDASGVPEVMRGEETKLAALLAEAAESGYPASTVVCMPGTHCKWARAEGGRVVAFATHMTGEVYAALSGHTILARTLDADAPLDAAAFDEGLARAATPGGPLHHLFGVRTRALLDGLGPAASASYLSGLLVGHELRAALDGVAEGAEVRLVGAGALVERYGRAITASGRRVLARGEDAAARGLYLLWRAASGATAAAA